LKERDLNEETEKKKQQLEKEREKKTGLITLQN
jgi:hypothetical protein